MTAPKTRKSKSKESITVASFKQWLSGVEDMQPTDWSPDASQWAKIRAKIMLISEEEVEVIMPADDQQPVIPTGPLHRIPQAQQFDPQVPPQESELSSFIPDVAPPPQYAPAPSQHNRPPRIVSSLQDEGFTTFDKPTTMAVPTTIAHDR